MIQLYGQNDSSGLLKNANSTFIYLLITHSINIIPLLIIYLICSFQKELEKVLLFIQSLFPSS